MPFGGGRGLARVGEITRNDPTRQGVGTPGKRRPGIGSAIPFPAATARLGALAAAALLAGPARAAEAVPRPADAVASTAGPTAASAGASTGGGTPNGTGAPVATPQAGPAVPGEPQLLTPEEGDTWADWTHGFLVRELAGLTERLEEFFGDERAMDLDPPGTVARVRGEVRIPDRGSPGTRFSALADVRLPATEAWLSRTRLVFAGETQADPNRNPDDPANPTFAPSLRAESAALELREVILQQRDRSLDAGVGVSLRIPPAPFARVRYRGRYDLGLRVEARLNETLFWRRKDGFGTTTQLDLTRPLAAHTLLRTNNGATLSEITRGVEWYSELGVAHEFGSLRTAAWLAAGLSGWTRPAPEVGNTRVYFRLRRDVFRRWLFLEIEPEVAWPLDEAAGRRPKTHAVTLRAELHFDGRYVAPAAAEDRAGP